MTSNINALVPGDNDSSFTNMFLKNDGKKIEFLKELTPDIHDRFLSLLNCIEELQSDTDGRDGLKHIFVSMFSMLTEENVWYLLHYKSDDTEKVSKRSISSYLQKEYILVSICHLLTPGQIAFILGIDKNVYALAWLMTLPEGFPSELVYLITQLVPEPHTFTFNVKTRTVLKTLFEKISAYFGMKNDDPFEIEWIYDVVPEDTQTISLNQLALWMYRILGVLKSAISSETFDAWHTFYECLVI